MPLGDRAVDDRARRGHRGERLGVDLDLRAAARDGEHVVEREVGAGQDDACHVADHPMNPARRVARTALPAAQSANAPAATRTIVPPGGVSA